jgi:hypothetical protein
MSRDTNQVIKALGVMIFMIVIYAMLTHPGLYLQSKAVEAPVHNVATVTITNSDAYGRVYIDIRGLIAQGDDETFESLVGSNPDTTRVIVRLSSPGGNFASGISIASSIHEKHLATYVADNEFCGSICAIIWVSGSIRVVGGPKSSIAFHNVYNSVTRQASASGNAVLGAYLKQLGFSYSTIGWMTTPSIDEANYLTSANASQLGISVAEISDLPMPVQRPKVPQADPAPVPATTTTNPRMIRLRVAQDLHLRVAPDPTAGNVLGPAPNDFIPTGTIVSLDTDRCTTWGNVNYSTWCYINYQETRGWMSGWVNTHYLEYEYTDERYS